MIIDFTIKAILAGVLISLVTGPLGSFIVWRRMAYFGDTLAHSMLLGVGSAVLLNLPLSLGMIGVALIIALSLSLILKRKTLPTDAVLGIFAHTTLALGLILTTLLPETRINLLNFLYGDILSTSIQDLYWMLTVDIVVLLILSQLWQALLMITADEELAMVEGFKVRTVKTIFMILTTVIFAIAVQLTGVLLITALMVIPAVTARAFSKSPEMMVALSTILSICSVFWGIYLSAYWDFSAGPSIIVVNAVFFMMSLLKR